MWTQNKKTNKQKHNQTNRTIYTSGYLRKDHSKIIQMCMLFFTLLYWGPVWKYCGLLYLFICLFVIFYLFIKQKHRSCEHKELRRADAWAEFSCSTYYYQLFTRFINYDIIWHAKSLIFRAEVPFSPGYHSLADVSCFSNSALILFRFC